MHFQTFWQALGLLLGVQNGAQGLLIILALREGDAFSLLPFSWLQFNFPLILVALGKFLKGFREGLGQIWRGFERFG